MSEKVRVLSEDLRRFAGQLNTFQTEMQGHQSRIRGQFAEVSRVWRDPVQANFERELAEANKLLDRFLREVTDDFIPYLHKKADQIDDYQK